jgi:glycosyltransferase involved in cell wall biosynthesis
MLTGSLAIGGAERQVVTGTQQLRRRGHFVHVAAISSLGPLADELRASGAEVQLLARRWRFDAVGLLTSLISTVRDLRIDVIYSGLAGDNVFAAVARLFCRNVRLVFAVQSMRKHPAELDAFDRVVYWIEPKAARLTDRIIAVSSAVVADAVDRGMPAQKFTIIPNGIDVDRFRPDADARRDVRRELSVRDDENVIGIVARFAAVKNHTLFVEAAARLRRMRSDVLFLVVGGGSEPPPSLLNLAAGAGIDSSFRWLASHPQIEKVYPAFDVSTLCSRSEGFGNVLGEAMACGVPCVSTDVGAARDLIGDTGIVIGDHDPETLAAAWATLLASDLASRGELARSRITTLFSATAVAALVERALEGEP